MKPKKVFCGETADPDSDPDSDPDTDTDLDEAKNLTGQGAGDASAPRITTIKSMTLVRVGPVNT